MNESLVALVPGAGDGYPDPPCAPDSAWPEFGNRVPAGSAPNPVYAGVRQLLEDLGLDAARAGTGDWNPLGDCIRPGSRVLLKPNLVLDEHPRGWGTDCLITQAAVVRPLLDYAALALQGRGEVVVGDAPLQGTDFDRAVEASGLPAVLADFERRWGLQVLLCDLRRIRARKDERGHVAEWVEQAGDPAGYVEFDLGEQSLLQALSGDAARFRVANYPADETAKYHGPRAHRYVISGSALRADCILNLPKLKTHCKAGVTLGLKNFVGTVGRKECLAHHRAGGAPLGGDEYPDTGRLKTVSMALEDRIDACRSAPARAWWKLLYRVNERIIRTLGLNPIRDGGWCGNDTVWRMVHDLNRIARYGRTDGSLADTPQRTILTLVDGIVAGEHEGPLEPEPRVAGLLAGGLSPAAVDLALTTWMGFDWTRIPLLNALRDDGPWPLLPAPPEAISVSLADQVQGLQELAAHAAGVPFVPPDGWRGHIEREPGVAGPASS